MKKEDLKNIKEIIIDMAGKVDVVSFKDNNGFDMTSFEISPNRTKEIINKILKDMFDEKRREQ